MDSYNEYIYKPSSRVRQPSHLGWRFLQCPFKGSLCAYIKDTWGLSELALSKDLQQQFFCSLRVFAPSFKSSQISNSFYLKKTDLLIKVLVKCPCPPTRTNGLIIWWCRTRFGRGRWSGLGVRRSFWEHAERWQRGIPNLVQRQQSG